MSGRVLSYNGSEKQRLAYVRTVSVLMSFLREHGSGYALDDEQDCASLAHLLVRRGWVTEIPEEEL